MRCRSQTARFSERIAPWASAASSWVKPCCRFVRSPLSAPAHTYLIGVPTLSAVRSSVAHPETARLHIPAISPICLALRLIPILTLRTAAT